jgi:large repetitive protein
MKLFHSLARRGRRGFTAGTALSVTAATLAFGATVATAPAASAADNIAFRASAQAAYNQTTARATIPASALAGDALLLFVTNNSAATITSAPSGWTLEGTRTAGTDTRTTLYSKVAVASDLGGKTNAAVTFSATTKSTVTLLDYDGTDGTDPVAAFASAAETVTSQTHTTPGAAVATAGSYVVSYWADKGSSTATSAGWTLPTGQTERSTVAGTGTGRISAEASDANAPTGVGPSPGVAAKSVISSKKATMWTVVLQADQTASPNVKPVAAFTVSCPQLTCTVDGSTSTDTAPGTVKSYAWDFGDGTTGTGRTTTHTYATSGTKTISLVVTDDQGLASDKVTKTAATGGTGGGTGNGMGGDVLPGHTHLVPDKPRTNTPRISNGEIWDIEVVPSLNRVFIAGSFTSAANTVSPTTTINQANLLSYNLTTGLIDTSFRPTFNGGVSAVEATPDGSKLFVAGNFNTVNGVAEQKVASLNLTTGAPLSTFDFSKSTNNQATALATTNSTLYVGGKFSRINGVTKTGLAAVNTASGAVDTSFSNDISGGIGVNGALSVSQLKVTHDGTKLLVVHTGRQIAGQDRLGMGIINISGSTDHGTADKTLYPWRSTLWDDNLARVGGVTRIYAADVAPDDSYFVVSSGSGGDAPPISDVAIRFPLTDASLTDSNVQYQWIDRNFDSTYSVAITEDAVYIGGHFGFVDYTPGTADQPYPGLTNVGYGTGQGLAGYGLGDDVVRRDHIAALSPDTGRALEWNPTDGSNSFEGNKAMEATPRGLFTGGDGMYEGGVKTGRVAFYDFNSVTYPAAKPDTTITTPVEGRVVPSGTAFSVTGSASVASGTVGRVQVSIQNRDNSQYLTSTNTWTRTATTVNATLDAGNGTTRTWHLDNRIATGNLKLLVSAQAFTAATGGSGDTTKATKKFETFGTSDQTPTTNITGPSGIQTSTSFTMTGTAVDDKGVNSLSYWFRDANDNYLQDDGSVSAIFHTFRGTPDVIGATNATWSYDVTLPHEGVWRGSATATDTAGQADLRSATRDWTVDSNAVSPTVTIDQPAAMTPPFAVPAVTVAPGGKLTFSGTASDDENLQNVEISLRNTSTKENLGNDCSWGTGVTAGNCRVSPVDIAKSNYNWTWTTPFNLSAGSYTFSVRATDESGLTTSSTNQGKLTINAQIAGDLPPDTTMSFTAPTDKSLAVNLGGTATDDKGVAKVNVTLQDRDTGRYLQPDGKTMSATPAAVATTLGTPNGTSTTWSLPVTLPTAGNWSFTAVAVDSAGQQDQSTSGATASYAVYPNDGPPSLSDTLGQPQSGATFDQGVIVVTGRADDAPDASASIASVQVAVVNSLGQYMSSSGTFTSTTASYRSAFLNSPGSAGSNYSYTTPVIPAGTYTVIVQPVDVHNQIGTPRTSTGIVVTQPSNNPPGASFTYNCIQNVCTFDGRGSTDEDTASLTYSWSFGTQGTATGPLPTKTFTAPGTFPVTLTVTDKWKATNTSAAQNVVIVEPAGNAAPVPTFTQNCTGLTCSVSSQGTTDPNTGDVISYSWNWGDGTAASTGASPAAHTYAASGSYTITLTTTDGWGKSASTTRSVSLTEPTGNTAPVVTFTASCPSYTVCQMNSAGTVDNEGDAIKYSWAWGDNTTPTTTANPTHTYATPGTYHIVLTVTDVWGKAASLDQPVTITEPASNNAPTAVIASGTCTTFTTCAMSGTGSSDPDTATGDGIRNYVWSWGDGTADTTGTTASQSHVYNVAGTYTVTLKVQDKWGHLSAPVTQSVTTQSEPAGNAAPTVVFNQPSCTVLSCSVSASGTADSDGGIRNYTWQWGEGSTVADTVTTSTSSSHTYLKAGTYTITLVVTDNWGRTTTVTKSVTVG